MLSDKLVSERCNKSTLELSTSEAGVMWCEARENTHLVLVGPLSLSFYVLVSVNLL